MKNKMKSFLLKPVFLLSVSGLLLGLSALGSAQAALTYYSENYQAGVNISSIGVSLMENGKRVSYRDYNDGKWNENKEPGKLLQHLKGDGEENKIVPGKAYEERLSVQNSGEIDTYVRVIIYKDWQDPKGRRDTSLSPELIDLHMPLNEGWVLDEKASTRERAVLYYTKILPAKADSPALSDTLKIHADIAKKATESVTEDEKGYKTITTRYTYDGYQFNLTAEVDAVQTHNAQDAIKSAWGVDVDVAADGSISLQQ